MSSSEDASDTEIDSNEPEIKRVNNYQRKRIIKLFSEGGSSARICKKFFTKNTRIKAKDFADLVNKYAIKSQQKVEEEAESQDYLTMDKWAQFFKEHELHSKSREELSLILRTIALMEPTVKTNDKEDIDFRYFFLIVNRLHKFFAAFPPEIRKLYLWLADVMVGNAPPELNAQSQLFLVDNLKTLIAETNDNQNELLEITNAICKKVNSNFAQQDPLARLDFVNCVDPFELNYKNKKY